MKFLLFDSNAISTYVSNSLLQSIEYAQGAHFVEHIRGKHQSEIFMSTVIEYYNDGIIFMGKEPTDSDKTQGHKVFCIDLTKCDFSNENDSSILLIMQKVFRTALKIWNHQPFSFSERVHETKSIVFPFSYPDARRIVIERSKSVLQLEKRSIGFPLLAYKYNAEDSYRDDEEVDVTVLKAAGKLYASKYYELRKKLNDANINIIDTSRTVPLRVLDASQEVGRGDFIYWSFEQQYNNLTRVQKEVVDFKEIDSPLRIDGAAGTGKTMSMIMRAYKLLETYRKNAIPLNVVFFSHSQSTFQRNLSAFQNYPNSSFYLDEESSQHISFCSLSDYCACIAGISPGALLERDAGDAKTYQLMLIEGVLSSETVKNRIRTYRSLISPELRNVFDSNMTAPNALYLMLQHEFSIQIKGRTDSTIDNYYDIPSIPNGLPCITRKDKELVFSLFNDYQSELQSLGAFDVDDVVMEAMSRLNAPIWRRERATRGFDYILVDEMHLFNINEQSVFHYLSKSRAQKSVPICFAIDYSQAIGDRGDVHADYVETAFGATNNIKYHTVFRNSPQITNFCISIATSGVIMFHEGFSNPYHNTQSGFVQIEEEKR